MKTMKEGQVLRQLGMWAGREGRLSQEVTSELIL